MGRWRPTASDQKPAADGAHALWGLVGLLWAVGHFAQLEYSQLPSAPPTSAASGGKSSAAMVGSDVLTVALGAAVAIAAGPVSNHSSARESKQSCEGRHRRKGVVGGVDALTKMAMEECNHLATGSLDARRQVERKMRKVKAMRKYGEKAGSPIPPAEEDAHASKLHSKSGLWSKVKVHVKTSGHSKTFLSNIVPIQEAHDKRPSRLDKIRMSRIMRLDNNMRLVDVPEDTAS